MSTASVLRLLWIDSGEKSACTNFALPCASALRLRARDERRGLDREPEGLGRALQRIGLLVDAVLELVGSRREFLRGLLPLEIGLDLPLHLFERPRLRRIDRVELDHVIAEIGLDRADDVADLHPEHCVVERLHHVAATEGAQIAALRSRTRILRKLLREIAELRRIGLCLRVQVLGLFPCSRLLLGLGVRFDGDQDVRRVALLGLRVRLQIVVVLRLDFGRVGRRLRGERVLREHEVLDLRELGRLERRGVGVVIGLDRRVVDLHALHERLGIDRRGGDFALLLEQADVTLAARPGDDVSDRDGLGDRREQQILAHPLLEALGRHVLRSEQLPVAFGGKLPVLLERRNLRNELLELSVGYAERFARRDVLHQAPVDDLLQHREANLRIVEHRRVVVGAELRAHAILLFGECRVEFGLRDLLAGNRRHVRRHSALPKVVVDAEERERQRDETQDDLDHPLVLAYEIEHARVLVSRRRGASWVRPAEP